MKIHIFSRELEVLEYGREEMPSPEEIGEQVLSDLIRMGLEPWPSIELEAFTYHKSILIFASTAKVFIPALLSALLGDM